MKLLTLLKALKSEELKEFERFLQFRSYKRGERYLKLCKLLHKEHPALDASKAEMEAIYKRCFGKADYTDSKFYNLLSGMSRQVEDFMVMKMALGQVGASDGRLRRELLVKTLGNRNMGAYFREEATRLAEEVGSNPAKEVADYLMLEQLYQQIYFHADTPKLTANSPDLDAAVLHLDLYYWSSKLRYATEMKARELLFNVRYSIISLEEVLEKTSNPILQEHHRSIAIYHQLIWLYNSGTDEAGFRKLTDMFLTGFYDLSPADQRFLLQHLINFGASLRRQNFQIQPEMLSIYKKAIDAGILLINNRLTDGAFTNIVLLALACREYDWAKGFMIEFSPFLEESLRHPVLAVSESNLYYHLEKLDEAQNVLTPDIFSIPNYDIQARNMLLRIAFDRFVMEGKDYDFLMAHIKAYEKYIKAKNLSSERELSLLNFIRYTKKLATVKFAKVDPSEEQKQMLRQKLKSLRPLVYEKWLAERTEML